MLTKLHVLKKIQILMDQMVYFSTFLIISWGYFIYLKKMWKGYIEGSVSLDIEYHFPSNIKFGDYGYCANANCNAAICPISNCTFYLLNHVYLKFLTFNVSRYEI